MNNKSNIKPIGSKRSNRLKLINREMTPKNTASSVLKRKNVLDFTSKITKERADTPIKENK